MMNDPKVTGLHPVELPEPSRIVAEDITQSPLGIRKEGQRIVSLLCEEQDQQVRQARETSLLSDRGDHPGLHQQLDQGRQKASNPLGREGVLPYSRRRSPLSRSRTSRDGQGSSHHSSRH